MPPKRESIPLTETQKRSLEEVAASVGAVNRRGSQTGKPSWRALVYAIADKIVKVTKKRGR